MLSNYKTVRKRERGEKLKDKSLFFRLFVILETTVKRWTWEAFPERGEAEVKSLLLQIIGKTKLKKNIREHENYFRKVREENF